MTYNRNFPDNLSQKRNILTQNPTYLYQQHPDLGIIASNQEKSSTYSQKLIALPQTNPNYLANPHHFQNVEIRPNPQTRPHEPHESRSHSQQNNQEKDRNMTNQEISENIKEAIIKLIMPIIPTIIKFCFSNNVETKIEGIKELATALNVKNMIDKTLAELNIIPQSIQDE